MFEDQQPAGTQQIASENQIDDRLAARKVIRSVRKNDVELLGTAPQVEKNIRLDGIEVVDPEDFAKENLFIVFSDAPRNRPGCPAR